VSVREQAERVLRRLTILQTSLALAIDRYRGGYAAYIEQLDAQRNLFQADLDTISVHEQQLNNLVQLWAALGGGWTGPGRE
jgi:outer membrane protein TolC